MHALHLLFFVLAAQSVVACVEQDSTYKGKKAVLVQIPEPPNSKIKRIIGGNVEVLDGCRFQVTNMTLIPSSNDMYWYGIPWEKPPEEAPQTMRLVPARLGNYLGNTIFFHLPPGVNWNDLAVAMIYSEPDHRAVAAFGVRGKVKDHFSQHHEKADLKWDPTDPLAGSAVSKRVTPLALLLVIIVLCF